MIVVRAEINRVYRDQHSQVALRWTFFFVQEYVVFRKALLYALWSRGGNIRGDRWHGISLFVGRFGTLAFREKVWRMLSKLITSCSG